MIVNICSNSGRLSTQAFTRIAPKWILFALRFSIIDFVDSRPSILSGFLSIGLHALGHPLLASALKWCLAVDLLGGIISLNMKWIKGIVQDAAYSMLDRLIRSE